MATTQITQDDFQSTVTGDGITLVDFWADWCGPCKQFGPVYEKVSEANPDVTFAKVDTDANQELAAQLQITSIPTLMAFRDGVLVYNKPGAVPAKNLEEILTAVRELDMDEIKKQIAEHDAGHENA
ncbi:thioredoxin [Georgenia sp. Z1344]|uniref:thioredoxin n=1 Tax=Georgenia sp. Z1344 TaxID=3416706 RepID=UPI003CEEE18E